MSILESDQGFISLLLKGCLKFLMRASLNWWWSSEKQADETWVAVSKCTIHHDPTRRSDIVAMHPCCERLLLIIPSHHGTETSELTSGDTGDVEHRCQEVLKLAQASPSFGARVTPPYDHPCFLRLKFLEQAITLFPNAILGISSRLISRQHSYTRMLLYRSFLSLPLGCRAAEPLSSKTLVSPPLKPCPDAILFRF